MRKKTARSYCRKHRLLPRGFRRHRGPDETDWILLDAEVAPRPVGIRRRKLRFAWLIRGAAILALLASGGLASHYAHRLVFVENDEFVLRRLEVATDGMLRPSTLREIANVAPGMNLMEIDLGAIQGRIETLPMVGSASVSRELPDRLAVVVKERTPVAWLSCPPLGIRPGDMERGFLLDKEGVIFRCVDLTEPIQQLPVIESYRLSGEPAEGSKLDVEGIEIALELISIEEEVPGLSDLMVHAIKMKSEWSIQCLYRSGLEVTFALEELERGLEDLVSILSHEGDYTAPLKTVDLTVSQNIPVTFFDPIDGSAVSAVAQPLLLKHERAVETREESAEKHLRSILNNG
ncbi:MAG: FtsQ-type POTRA domain-containing protein [Verrucomicrobiota bacterium]